MVLEAGRTVLSKVLISGGGRCNVMHNPEKAPGDIANVLADSVMYSVALFAHFFTADMNAGLPAGQQRAARAIECQVRSARHVRVVHEQRRQLEDRTGWEGVSYH